MSCSQPGLLYIQTVFSCLLRTRLSTVGDRAFPVAAARLWNSLPSHVTAAPTSPSSAVILNHISSHFLSHCLTLHSSVQCPRSDASFWWTIIVITFNILTILRRGTPWSRIATEIRVFIIFCYICTLTNNYTYYCIICNSFFGI